MCSSDLVSGGCAVNAAIAVARLGGSARYAGPLGDSSDNVSNQLMAEMAREGIDTSGVARALMVMVMEGVTMVMGTTMATNC